MISLDIYTLLKEKQHNTHYLNRYYKFITHCVLHNNNSTGHIHHILPKSMWSEYSNLKKYRDNGVLLTIRQHFIAHWILHKCYSGKMSGAFMYMLDIGYDISFKVTSKVYEKCLESKFTEEWRENVSRHRKEYLKQIDPVTGLSFAKINADKVALYMKSTLSNDGETTLSEQRAIKSSNTKSNTIIDGKTLHEIIGERISKAHNTVNIETGLSPAQVISMKVSKTRIEFGLSSGENNPQFGKFGEQHPKFGHKHSDETKRKQSDALKGKPHKTGICEFCGVTCSLANLSRWHNDNCKLKPFQ